MTLRNKIIKLLGGYTPKEYQRLENKYQGLLDSKTTLETSKIVNEYEERILRDLYHYAKSLYGSAQWSERMYNAIRNNWLKVRVRYVDCGSPMYYKFDNTLDGKNEFTNILKEEDPDKYFILENDNDL